MQNSRKATINDIARIAEVSKTTVSYVINRRQSGFHISEETARRVLQVCKKLNYCPDEAAVRLSECRKNPLHLLVASPWLYTQFSDFMAQLNIVLQKHESRSCLDVSYASYAPGELRGVLQPSAIRRYDAVLVVGTRPKDDQYLTANAENLAKIVLMNRRVEGFLSCSGNDQTAIAKLARKIHLKHYDRAVVVVSTRKSSCEQLRCGGFSAVCAAAGLPCGDFFTENYGTLADQLVPVLASQKGKTLVFIPQYVPAALVLTRALEAGLRIPEDLGIVAYDRHSLLDRFISPALTTVDPNLDEMAEETLKLIYGVREGLRQPSSAVKAKLYVGGTTVNLKNKSSTGG